MVKMYINGSDVGVTNEFTGASSIRTDLTDGFFSVSRNSATNRYYFDGLVDELIVWDDIRTPTEIAESYNSGDGKIYVGDEANMISYWRMEDDLTDSHESNGNDLTNNNSATFNADVPFPGEAEVIVETKKPNAVWFK